MQPPERYEVYDSPIGNRGICGLGKQNQYLVVDMVTDVAAVAVL